MMFRIKDMLALAALTLPLAAVGCGFEKMNQEEARGGTRVDNVPPISDQPGIGAAPEVRQIDKEGGLKVDAGADSSTPYSGGGAGMAPPLTPNPAMPPSGDTNSGQTSSSKIGPGSDANTMGALPTPGATGPGANPDPK